jgi:hypothetical protein
LVEATLETRRTVAKRAVRRSRYLIPPPGGWR